MHAVFFLFCRYHTQCGIVSCPVATVLPMRGGSLAKRSRALTAGEPFTKPWILLITKVNHPH